MAKKAKAANEPSLRDKLSEDFLRAFQTDFEVHGTAVIEQLREKDPAKYAAIGAQLIAAAQQVTVDPYAGVESQEDLARALLRQIGLSDAAMTPSMLEQAETANDVFISRLQQIAQGN
jgi:predicted component of type VI protein secretion system